MKTDNYQSFMYTPKFSFTSCERKYKAVETITSSIFAHENIYTTTSLFRKHLDWKKYISYVIEHFKNKDNVKIYSLGCSDGSEAYSYAIALADRLPAESLSKYFPIQAVDIDPEIINAANTGRINLDAADLRTIKENLINIGPDNPNEFWADKFLKKIGRPLSIKNDSNLTDHSIFDPLYSYTPVGAIKNSVKFYTNDILSELECISDKGNSIINISHVLGYCDESYVDKVLKKLQEKLKSGSLFVFDDRHNTNEFRKRLSNVGFFFPLDNACVAQKI